ncbi:MULTISPECIES: hypothetical protein [unclassified Novosphingobium]|uniref:hypothetical protein n=1 Tax=unclassified Novosphingobium TaxID=2644732 RepID=UPI000F7D9179|nr:MULTISPECIES: hypothetical protein [unclassified Novosphingobium]
MKSKFAPAKNVEAFRTARRKRNAAAKRRAENRKISAERKAKPDIVAAFDGKANLQAASRTKHSAAERIETVMQSKADCRKELTRLYALVAKLTASVESETPRPHYVDEKALAAMWGVSVKFLRNLRSKGDGPMVTYFGRNVRYRLKDARAYAAENAFASRTARQHAIKV